jgi:hypothetical protein
MPTGVPYSSEEERRAGRRRAENAYRQRRRALTPGFDAEKKRRKHLRREYGITPEEFENMLHSQNGQCAICGTFEADAKHRRLHVDHDHITGKVRGLLCGRCNMMLGYALENTMVLEAAIAYLKDDICQR